MRKSWIIAAILILIVLNGGIYTVQEQEQVIITQFGKPVGGAIKDPGLKFKVPFIQQAHRFEKRFLEWDGSANELPTKDKRFVWIDTYARWRITDPLKFFQRLRDERRAHSRLDGILNGETRNAIANHNLLEVIRSTNRESARSESVPEDDITLATIETGRDKIRKEILRRAREEMKKLDLGIEILDVQFKRINYVEEVRRKVYERMIAERQRIADRFTSEGQGEAKRILGEKERELKRIQSGAYREAREIIGDADATAIEIYANAYDRSQSSRDFYEYLRTLETYRTTIDSNTKLVLSTDNEFYRWLKKSDGSK